MVRSLEAVCRIQDLFLERRVTLGVPVAFGSASALCLSLSMMVDMVMESLDGMIWATEAGDRSVVE